MLLLTNQAMVKFRNAYQWCSCFRWCLQCPATSSDDRWSRGLPWVHRQSCKLCSPRRL